jgi:1,4-alpha-glucan branching enzyme
MNSPKITADLRKIVEARHHDPFSVLGRHTEGGQTVVRAQFQDCFQATIAEGNLPMERIPGTDIFEWRGDADQLPERYRFIWQDTGHHDHIIHDPYCFPAQLSDFDLHLFGEGKHWHAYRFLGAHPKVVDGVKGVLFAVWAPNAERVSVVGEFNHWDGRVYPMRVRGDSGVWEIFIPDIEPGALYKFEIRNRNNGNILLKSDPYGRAVEQRPKTASIVVDESPFDWHDQDWVDKRKNADWLQAPMSIFEVHLGSWQRGSEGEFLNYRELATLLVEYVLEMGFSHIELLPISEHPYDPSWGYQTTGYYAPTSRFGSPDDFRWFVDHCHQHGIGVFLDWVPAHFPKDAHGLAYFDGQPLYEHADPRRGEHLDWSTLIFDYGRSRVKNFLLSNALYWLEEFHLDGLRVDAVASMLYLDYSRENWLPNRYGGRENLEAIDFLKELNTVVHGECPGILVMAEESTAWPQVTQPVHLGGLGFSLKWNMGWMNDTLEYISRDPIHRRYHQGELTFSMIYAFTENFLLPFSHDEVVHGKGSMLNKMPGDEWQRFANLRLLYTYMFTHPGKKLMFMGTEFGQGTEWDATGVLDWYVLGYAFHEKLQRLVKALNRLYAEQRPLHQYDFDSRGFEWIDYHDVENSVLVYQRKSDDEFLVIALNLTPTPRTGYRIGVPKAGAYHELLNSDADYFGGSNVVNASGSIMAEENPWMNHPYSLTVTLPPLAGIILKPGELPTGSRVENPIAAIGKSSAVEPKPASKPKINAGDSGKQPTP